ncbi:MAG: ShlB/FhaC/HecB family hemolysin secretion/activation protein [Gammaproteobacteria bacterium]
MSQQVRISVKEIRLDGNTIFSDVELKELIEVYENREITSGELESLRQALTLLYVNRGYINSGAVIPDQKVTDGVIHIRIVEGVLNDINIKGRQRLKSAYFTERIALGSAPPLNVNTLSQALQFLQQNPRIDQLHAALVPGTAPGEAILDIQVREARPYHLRLGADNARAPSVGGEQGYLQGLHRNLTGLGDTLNFKVAVTDGLEEFDISYALPVTPKDTDLKLWYVRNNSKVVDDPFDELDIEADEISYGIGLQHPVYRTLNQNVSLGVSLERRKSETQLLGEPFSFSPGAENGEVKLTIMRFTQEWLDRYRRRVLAVRSTFSFGLDALGATVNGNDGDGKFVSWLGQFQWAQRLGERNQVILRADAQFANDALPSLEQFAAGGLHTVRGYRENRQVTDQGFIASLEFRFPVWTSKDGRNSIQIAPFYDYAAVRNRSRPTPGPRNFSSPGVGILGDFANRVHAGLYYGHALQDFDDPDDDIQDDGFHFTVTLDF